jgi:hypothetical protein
VWLDLEDMKKLREYLMQPVMEKLEQLKKRGEENIKHAVTKYGHLSYTRSTEAYRIAIDLIKNGVVNE